MNVNNNLPVLSYKPGSLDPEALELIIPVDDSLMDGSVKLKAADVVDAIIAANLVTVHIQVGVKDWMFFWHWFHVTNLYVLALRVQDVRVGRRVFGEHAGGRKFGLEPLRESPNPFVFQATIDEDPVAQKVWET